VKRFSIRPRTRPHFRNDFLTEKENLFEVAKWNHPHLLGMFATFETRCWCSGFETLNIVLPFARGGNLYEFLRLEQETRWEQREYPTSDPSLIGCLADWRYAVFRETVGLAEAVAALHEDRNGKFILHCDIKPSNILIQRGVFKIADFGLSRLKDSDETSKTEWHRGTALYSPPERESLLGRGRDVWALGCVFLEIAHMIRFAFQDAILCKIGATRQPMYEGLRNMIDMFELDRKNSVSKTGERTAIYHKTIDYVRQCMRAFYEMRAGLRRRIILDGMFPVIQRMLDEDQKTRITAAEAAAQMRANYLGLQDDPQLQEAIIVWNNPGGPPAETFDLEWNQFGTAYVHNISTIMPNIPAQYDNVPNRLPLMQTATAPTSSTGQTEKMNGVALDETKRPASSEDNSHHQPHPNQRSAPPRYLGGAMPSLDGFASQSHRRSSSMEDSGNKRRRTDAPF
jgi:serine/threonine protein kinase